MFFKAKHFMKILSEEDAELVAEEANEVIRKQSKVIQGNYFADGSLDNFSTTEKDKDTHVAIAIGVTEMGLFDDEREIHTTSPEVKDYNEAMSRKVEALERELRQKRKMENKDG